jgi:hypothetical protein
LLDAAAAFVAVSALAGDRATLRSAAGGLFHVAAGSQHVGVFFSGELFGWLAGLSWFLCVESCVGCFEHGGEKNSSHVIKPFQMEKEKECHHETVLTLPKIFAYGDDGFHDFGFGCMYRCCQTLQGYYKIPVQTVPDMIRCRLQHNTAESASGTAERLLGATDKTPGETRALWAEPSDVPKLLYCPNEPGVKNIKRPLPIALLIYSRDLKSAKTLLARRPTHATVDEYDQVVTSAEWLWDVLQTSLDDGHPFIIDDKTNCYVLFGVRESSPGARRSVLLGDPHTPSSDVRCYWVRFEDFCRTQWMLATACQKCV